jgi:photosystem II S4 domain protein
MLPLEDLLEGSQHRPALTAILHCAERALRTWEPCWSGFVDGAVREEAQSRLGVLAELAIHSAGGFPGAERRRLLLQRQDAAVAPEEIAHGLMGLELSGNFLFDPYTPADFRQGLITTGGADPEGLGDCWLRGDRGAQIVATTACAQALDGRTAQVGRVEIQLVVRPLVELQLPALRQPKRISCVEASLRLDALASAGFGLSRSRMAERIRQGELSINWQTVASPSRELTAGDRVQWSGRGELCVEDVSLTKRERWRIQLLRL